MATADQDTWIASLGFDLSAPPSTDGGDAGNTPGGIFDRIKRRLTGKSGTAPDAPEPDTGSDTGTDTGTGTGSETSAPPGPPKAPILGSAQQGRAAKLLAKLSEPDKKAFNDLLNKAGPKQGDYLTKSLAAGHSVSEITAFAAKIAGKDDTWLQDNLSLTGSSTGSGVQQQWSHSCNATTVQAVKGELDPIYALKMHEDNPNMGTVDDTDATKDNPNLAEDQRKMLESTYHGATSGDHAGVAANRDNASGTGSGRWANDLLDQMKDVTGLTYDTKKVGTDTTKEAAITAITDDVGKGNPVPIVIGNAPGQFTHYVLVTASDPGPPRMFSIHDPWSGKTVTRSEKQMKDGTLDIAGSNTITAFEKPTPVEMN